MAKQARKRIRRPSTATEGEPRHGEKSNMKAVNVVLSHRWSTFACSFLVFVFTYRFCSEILPRVKEDAVIEAALPLKILDSKETASLMHLLSSPVFSFLGDWRFNLPLVKSMNKRLATGKHVVVEGFFEEQLANNFHKELTNGANDSWFVEDGTPFNTTGVDLNLYKAADARKRCELLRGKNGFRFRYHVADPPKSANVNEVDHPSIALVARAISSSDFARLLSMLMTGREPPREAKCYTPSARLFENGDYTLLHDDVRDNDKSKVRALGLNYYLVQDWNAAWGGNFLWCGTNQEGSDAQRIVPGFNQAVLFVPGSSAWHAVEVVQKEPSATAQRFSFSTWLRIHANSASQK